MNRSLRRIFLRAVVLAAAVPFSASALQESGPSKAALAAGELYMRTLESAASAFAARDFATALDKLDMADQIQANIPDTWAMRGAVYAEQHQFDKAQDAFQLAARLNPGDFWAPYNLAELLLVEKKYAEAAAAFEKLTVYQGHEELVQFKIVFADLMQGKPDAAKPVLDAMKFPGKTPSYYFAHAAWGFAHKDKTEGTYWVNSALKIFGTEPCIPFYDTLVGEGWVAMRELDGSIPEPTQLFSMPAPTPEAGGLTP